MKRIRKLEDLRLGVTYDVGRTNGPPFRGRLFNLGEETDEDSTTASSFAVFVVNAEHRSVRADEFISAKPVTGKRFRRD